MDISTAQNFFENLSGTSFSLVVILGAIIFSALYALLLGKDKILAILFATYASFSVSVFFPYDEWLASTSADKIIMYRLIIFLVGVVLFSLIFMFTHATRGDLGGSFLMKIIKGVFFGIAQIGLLASITMYFVPDEWLLKIPEWLQQIFISQIGLFVWFLAPVVILIFTKGRHKGPGRPRIY